MGPLECLRYNEILPTILNEIFIQNQRYQIYVFQVLEIIIMVLQMVLAPKT